MDRVRNTSVLRQWLSSHVAKPAKSSVRGHMPQVPPLSFAISRVTALLPATLKNALLELLVTATKTYTKEQSLEFKKKEEKTAGQTAESSHSQLTILSGSAVCTMPFAVCQVRAEATTTRYSPVVEHTARHHTLPTLSAMLCCSLIARMQGEATVSWCGICELPCDVQRQTHWCPSHGLHHPSI